MSQELKLWCNSDIVKDKTDRSNWAIFNWERSSYPTLRLVCSYQWM